MRLNFFGFDSSYHVARYHFVSKVPRSRTPLWLARHRAGRRRARYWAAKRSLRQVKPARSRPWNHDACVFRRRGGSARRTGTLLKERR